MNTVPQPTASVESEPGSGQPDPQAHPDSSSLKDYHRIVLLTDGFSTPFLAKTAISLLRYRTADIAAVLDASQAGQTAQALLGAGGDLPVIASLDQVPADALFIGIAPPGGALPATWRPIVSEALRRGIDVVSGLHDFLCHDPEFVSLAQQHGSRLIDVRRNTIRDTAQGVRFRDGCLRIHTVGHDCSVGKMVVALEVQQALAKQNVDARFLATGQTGIMISGAGFPIDCVVADFVNGAAETLVKQHEQHDVLLIEGQGCISHPSFSAVTLGLLHGCAPDGLIFCYEVGRTMAKGYDQIELLSHRRLIDAYEANASLRHPCRVIGVAMNSRKVSAEEAAEERQRVSEELGLPVCDVYRDGPAPLVDAVRKLKQELQR
ncbi:DUF1611 domain-containing protein [Roseimaritima ulvae]|uniref:DUF1611 domain-containing protein n=1 Tax=Roseimaritima ulvae TaxID=980254 RepID=A0A5B9QR23_9BACT|nr:DUF1611 domain-containing protein [Roseimaritima ulvae]QEG39486.1 hypothetical protein UC8_14810 [Roseimaritima ulvae]